MSKPLFVITVAAPTTAELRRRRDAASQAGADLVELRLDSVSDPDVTGALAGRMGPCIVTCRPEWEGGAFKDAESERKKLLDCALQRGAEYIDLEFKAAFASELIGSTGGKRIVLSSHDFEGIPRICPNGCGRCERRVPKSSRWPSRLARFPTTCTSCNSSVPETPC